MGDIIYAINDNPDTGYVWDTLPQAFTTITSSRQELHWWGEDTDGDVVGYQLNGVAIQHGPLPI